MKQLFSFFVLLFFVRSVMAQDGAPLLTHFRQNRETENQSWAICQDRNKVMLFANRKGILSFDGEEWSPIRIQLTPFSMEMNPFDKRIYIGGENDYGYLEKDLKGFYRYFSLKSDSTDVGVISRIIFNDSIACFFGDRSVSNYNFRTGKSLYRILSEGAPFTGVFMNPRNTFVNVEGKGLFRVEKDTLFPIVSGYLTENTGILFSLNYNNDLVLIGFDNNKLSLFDGMKYYDYPILDDGYLSNNILSQGISLGDSLYAFSTLEGGTIVINRDDKKIKFIINNQTGLPDDEVFAIGNDESGGLWISHPFGLTRADLNIPVRNFSIYPGLKGNLTASVQFNNDLYVGTSEGVYYLAKEKSYTEIEVLRENEVKASPKVNAAAPAITIEKSLIPPPRQEKTRKNIFNRIFGKKDASDGNQETSSSTKTPEQQILIVDNVTLPKYTAQKIKKLKSIDYVFKKVAGLNEKCRQLVATKYGILAATNRGLYVIDNLKATLLSNDRYINNINPEPDDDIWMIAAADGYFLAVYRNGRWSVQIPDTDFSLPLYSVLRTGKNTYWLGGENVAYKATSEVENANVKYEKFSVKNIFSQRYLMEEINDSVFLMTETSINVFDQTSGQFLEYSDLPVQTYRNEGFSYPLSNVPLFRTGNEWIYLDRNKKMRDREISLLKLFDDIVSVNCENDNIWVVDGENHLFGINRKTFKGIIPNTYLFIRNIRNENGTSFDLANIVFERGDNVIDFEIVAPAYLKKNLTQYQYFIEKIMPGWSAWSTETQYKEAITSPGDYTLLVRAMDIWGEIGEPVSVQFTIKAPFTKTTIFYIIIISLIFIIIIGIVNFREKQLQEKNRILEEKVKERTAEIEAQKEEITSSIEYASRIQMAMLPVSNLFYESFSDFFLIFKPRDIVSGDFYWIGEDKENIFLTVADCTGHGVPGAFMSTLGISVLNEIVAHNDNLKANDVLNLLREKIKTSLHQTGKEGEAADGMDISLCVLKKNRKSIQFSGAYNSLFIFNNNGICEYKADRMPIGIYYGDECSFTNHEINVKKGDIIYLLSDGLTDQFGGPDGCKFKKAYLKKIFSEINMHSMAEQKNLIENEFLKWKGNNAQVDDITIIGVRI